MNSVDFSEFKQSETVVDYEDYRCKRYVFDINLSKSVCWHDCHHFSGEGIVIPKYKTHKKWYCIGVFCSWNCAKAYCIRYKIPFTNLNLFYKFVTGETKVIVPAYPRECLEIFGGVLNIDQFRSFNSYYTIKYSENPMIYSLKQQIIVDDIKILESHSVKTPQRQTRRKVNKTIKANKTEKTTNIVEDILFT